MHIDTIAITFSCRVSDIFFAATSFTLTHEESFIGFFIFETTGFFVSFEDFSTWTSFDLSLCNLVLLFEAVVADTPANSDSA